ncbi:hypothetical protein D3C87_1762160 [compost metagenome]
MLDLPVVAFVLAQLELKNFDLRAQGEAIGIVVEIVVGHAQPVFGEGPIIPAARAQLPGA